MAKLTVISWRDIPAQVIVQSGRCREKGKLSHRFQAAIDRAAMRAGKGSSDAYLSEWKQDRVNLDRDVEPQILLQERLAEIESAYSDDDLELLIRQHGLAREG